ncbi:MAG: phenylalanine--tRNA ligase subunit beta [Planctomycetota bacterium]
MKLSLRWLSRYVDLSDRTPEQIRDDLTMCTAEVEGIEAFGGGLDDLVIGKVLQSERHPDADKLTVNRVDVGGGEPAAIVCGAPNVAAGQTVAVVQPGATLPDGLKIKKAKIRGVESFGMICSERELGLSEDHSGIMVLDDALRPGDKFVDVVPVLDWVIEIDNKSVNHRPDLWGHYGFARELAATLQRPLQPLPATDLPADGRALPISIEDAADCPRFTGIVLTGAKTLRSPDWLRWALHAIDQRAINLLVDLTNYVMFDVGQPMHAFDLRRLQVDRGVGVRRAREGERMTTLDGLERSLEPTDLVVTSGDELVGLAGVMGGEGTAVAEDTTELFLESANFHPTRIRRTSARLGLRTDASARFEKSLDPANAELGSRRFVQLLGELCPGAAAAGPLVDPAEWRYERRSITLRKARLDAKLGIDVGTDRVRQILEGLEFGVTDTKVGFAVDVPSFRATKDITIEDDLIEEVGRMYRYDNIPEQPLTSVVTVPPREPALWLAREIVKIGAAELGAHEVYNYSFTPDRVLEAAGAPPGQGDGGSEYSRVANPVAPEVTRMRRHVMPSLLACVRDNLRRRGEVRLVEQGKGYHPEVRDEHGLPREVHEAAFVWSREPSQPDPASPLQRDAHPYGHLRSGIEALLRRAGVEVSLIEKLGPIYSWAHPGKTVAITCAEAVVGYVGHLHPRVCRAFEIPLTTAIANLDIGALVASGRAAARYRPIPRFPSQPVDVALLVAGDARVATIAAWLRAVGKKLVRGVELFEVYRGAGLPEGKKSLNFTVTLGADDRTLDTKDEERYLGKVRDRAAEVGAELRG